MNARYSGVCPICEGSITPGQLINYGDGRRARHANCGAPIVTAEPYAAPASLGLDCDDHPRVRRYKTCPVCAGVKDFGLLVCWPCYRKHDFRNNADACGDAIDDAEKWLAGETYGRPDLERGARRRRSSWRS